MAGTGDRAGAVAPAQEAVHLYRAQAAENRAYGRPRTGPTNPTWPAALNTLANRLSETGDRAGAVAPAQEAVDLRRAQAAENRAYEPDLAAALNNLAIRLSETGDRAGAVAPAQEAVDLRRASSGREPGLRTRPAIGVEQPGQQVV
ncbi:MAG: tetratricopeptide repeat protein [Candidatus Microthrix sp.]|nr:tetratricopeptide repeat protein [Candidatus Microthrix sp.]